MPARRRAAVGLCAAMTFSSAVLVHDVVHVVGSRGFEWDSPAHVGTSALALGLLGVFAAQLGVGCAHGERRRRGALLRAALRAPVFSDFALQCGVQVAIAASIFAIEGEGGILEPSRVALALACGLLALFASLFFLQAAEQRVVALVTAFSAPPTARAPRIDLLARSMLQSLATEPYRLFVPNRPPPFALS